MVNVEFHLPKLSRIWLALVMILGLLLATGITDVTSLPVAKAFSCGSVPDPLNDRTGNINSESDGITAINNARSLEGLGQLNLPGNFYSLSPEDRILTLFNLERADRGLPVFSHGNDLVLSRVAENHSQILISYNIFAHDTAIDGPLLPTPNRITVAPGVPGHYSSWGEIIAGAPFTTYQVFIWLYQDSDQGWGHRHIIFGCFSDIGIGSIAGGPYGSISTADFIQSNGSYAVPNSVDTTPPNLSVNPPNFNSSVSQNLTVTAVATDGGAGIRHVAFFRDGNFSGSTVPAGTPSGNTYSYTFTSVPPGTHTVSVIAVDKNNNYTRSDVTVLDNPPPAAPSNLHATAVTTTRIDLIWNDNSNNETQFQIQRGPDGVNWPDQFNPGPNGTSIATYSDTSVSPGTTYYYRVRAYNTGGTSSFTNIANATTLPNPPGQPAAPTFGTVTGTQIVVNWTGVSGTVSGYMVQRSPNSGGPWSTVTTTNNATFTYTDNSVGPATQYFYRIIAFNAGGNSTPSTAANTTTSAADFTVTSPNDDGSNADQTTNGKLSFALKNATSGQSIKFNISVGNTINVTGALPAVQSGVTIFGGECGTTGVILDGTGSTNGLIIHGDTLINITIQNFSGKQLTILPAPGRNILRCTKVIQT